MKIPENQKVVKSSEMKETKQEPLYGAFIQVRNIELSVYWTRYNIQSAINFGLIAVVLSSKTNSLIQQHLVYISVIGIFMAITWLCLTILGKRILNDWWEKHLRTYERTIPNQEHRLFRNIYKKENEKCWIKKNWQNLNILTRFLPILCLVVWLVILYYEFIKNNHIPFYYIPL